LSEISTHGVTNPYIPRKKKKDKRDIIDGKTERQGRRGKKKITNEDMRI
jgi:hypothetical protein